MSRRATLALLVSAIVGAALLVGGLIPSSLGQGPIRRDGPILHALGFALFALPLVATWPRKWWAFVIAACVFGVAIEGLQTFTDRATELEDIVANCVGAALGAGVGWVIARARKSRPGEGSVRGGRHGP